MSDIDISGSTVLVVDDNPQNLQVVGNLLNPLGFHLQFVVGGERVVDVASAEKPDLILLDIHMPKIDGFEVCRRLQGRPETREIPVIFLTAAYKDEESIVKGFEAGAVDYVTKPFFREELVARIRTHLQLKRYKEHLLELSITEPLTGLFNRRRMNERLTEEWTRVQRNGSCFAVVLGDVDRFKSFNDTYGHTCGDLVLKGIAKVLQDSIRGQDMVGRWGGEEFLVMLPETTIDGAFTLAEKLRAAVQDHPWRCDSQTMAVTITFGVACCDASVEPDECVRRADAALYQGKDAGRNRVVPWREPA